MRLQGREQSRGVSSSCSLTRLRRSCTSLRPSVSTPSSGLYHYVANQWRPRRSGHRPRSTNCAPRPTTHSPRSARPSSRSAHGAAQLRPLLTTLSTAGERVAPTQTMPRSPRPSSTSSALRGESCASTGRGHDRADAREDDKSVQRCLHQGGDSSGLRAGARGSRPPGSSSDSGVKWGRSGAERAQLTLSAHTGFYRS